MTDLAKISTHSARLFAEKYKNATSEKQLGESFWRDFFISVVGITDILVEGVEFQKPIRSSDGRVQFIDCFWDGVVLIEHKSAGKDLNLAEKQARGYLESLPAQSRPPTLIISDFKTIRIIEVIRGTSLEFSLTDLPENIERILSVISYKGDKAATPRVQADKNAVELMGQLFKEFDEAGYGGHELSVFLVRILFLNFGDDTRMWKFIPQGLFGTYVQSTAEDGSGLGGAIQELFQIINTPAEKRPSTISPSLIDFPYVNGGLFAETLPIFSFTSSMRDALIATTLYDWSTISPAIFGAMFQTVKDRELRRESGEFYTSEKAILRVISPLFLDRIYEQMQGAWNSVTSLKKLRGELGKKNYLDPASGSGNFLIVAYKKLREIELKITIRISELEGKPTALQIDGTIGLQVHLGQFHAIEIEEWSSQIAFVAMFLADHQSNQEMEEFLGVSPERFPITQSAVIKQANALQISWDSVCPMDENTYIMGNPPFNGSRLMTAEQKAETLVLWKGTKSAGNLDYVANWFLIGSKWSSEKGVRVGLVATSSISQGEQPALIWKKLTTWGVGIDFAYRSFWWDNGAAVHCVIIGFSAHPKPKKRPLWKFSNVKGEPELTMASNINAYLIDGPDVLVDSRSKPLTPGTPPLTYGNQPNDAGYLSNLSAEVAKDIRDRDPIAAKYLRKIVGARELLHAEERWCLWLLDAEPTDLLNSIIIKERIQKVREHRLSSDRPATVELANTPYLFGFINQPKNSYIAVPRHSSEEREYVPLALLDASVIASDAISLIADKSLFIFGLLMSRPFNIWNKTVSGRLESRTRISGSITYNNFPFPETTQDQVDVIEQAAQAVLDARNLYPESSLAALYNPITMPTALRKAHQKLDKTVVSAFEMKLTASDEDILAELFERYEEAISGLFSVKTTQNSIKKINKKFSQS